jgi:branched-chain amino acid transport system substrate-binding protein
VSRALPAVALVAVLAVALPVASAGPRRQAADPGVTATSVLLGGTVPLSGPAAAFGSVAAGAQAYFKWVNAQGGVNGRRIDYVYRDDGYDPARTVQETTRLVQQDKVFAIFNSAGTENAIAVRPFLNGFKVPQLFTGTGASTFAREFRRYPWSMGYLPSFEGEGAIYGRNIVRTRPRARVAVLYEDSDYGRDLLRGLRKALRAPARVVATKIHAPTDADVQSQVTSLRGSRANTLMIFTTPLFAIRTFVAANKLGWRPRVYVSAVSIEPTIMKTATLSSSTRATRDAISLAFLKDPTSPRWAKDRGVALYRTIMRRYHPRGEAGITDVYNFYGMAVARSMVTALRKAGRNLTRARLLSAATHLDERDNPFLLPGIAVRTTPRSYFPITRAQLYRYRGGRWQPFSGLLGARP